MNCWRDERAIEVNVVGCALLVVGWGAVKWFA